MSNLTSDGSKQKDSPDDTTLCDNNSIKLGEENTNFDTTRIGVVTQVWFK